MEAPLNVADYSDEDYIDMEVGSQETIIFCQSNISPAHPNREFEFQMFSSFSGEDTTTSPADELFYKGKLLPLHLPPRLQMVEKLLQNHGTYESRLSKTNSFEESFSTPVFTPSANTPTANTPFESCNISPAESCQVSRELNPDEYLQDYLAGKEDNHPGNDDQNPKKSWTRRLKLIKQSALNSKLKASRAYLKSFFAKSGCSDKSSATALSNVNESMIPNSICEDKHAIVSIKTPFGHIQKGRDQIISPVITRSFKKEDSVDNEKGHHRRSFCGAFKRISSSSSSSKYTSSDASSGSSSASSSNNSNGFRDMQFFKRSISTNMEAENPIQAAIAHCKKSQQPFSNSRKTLSDIGLCSLTASRIIHEDQERPGLCRG